MVCRNQMQYLHEINFQTENQFGSSTRHPPGSHPATFSMQAVHSDHQANSTLNFEDNQSFSLRTSKALIKDSKSPHITLKIIVCYYCCIYSSLYMYSEMYSYWYSYSSTFFCTRSRTHGFGLELVLVLEALCSYSHSGVCTRTTSLTYSTVWREINYGQGVRTKLLKSLKVNQVQFLPHKIILRDDMCLGWHFLVGIKISKSWRKKKVYMQIEREVPFSLICRHRHFCQKKNLCIGYTPADGGTPHRWCHVLFPPHK